MRKPFNLSMDNLEYSVEEDEKLGTFLNAEIEKKVKAMVAY